MENSIKATVEGDEIVIRCKIDNLVIIAEGNPENGYTVVDRDKFAKGVAHQFNTLESHRGSGATRLEDVFDDCIEYAYISQDDDDIFMKGDEE